MKKCSLVLLIWSILLLVSSNIAQAISPSDIQVNVRAEDENMLRSQAQDYAKAFAAGDAKTLANMWTEDGTFINIEGREFKGRDAIQLYFTLTFASVGGQPLEISVDSLKFPIDNVAIEEGVSRLLQGRFSGIMCHYTVLHVKNGGQWRMANVTETDYSSPAIDKLSDLSWLIGNWTATGANGEVVHFKTKWIANKHFIACVYQNSKSDQVDEMQIIGWNPRIEKIVSWHFGSEGGFGNSRWLRDGQNWVQNANNLEPDNTVSSGIYIIEKLDDNNFKWRSTGRDLSGHQLPEIKEIKVSRDQLVNN